MTFITECVALKEAARQFTKLLLLPPRSSKAGRIPVLLQLLGKKLDHLGEKSWENLLEMLSLGAGTAW